MLVVGVGTLTQTHVRAQAGGRPTYQLSEAATVPERVLATAGRFVVLQAIDPEYGDSTTTTARWSVDGAERVVTVRYLDFDEQGNRCAFVVDGRVVVEWSSDGEDSIGVCTARLGHTRTGTLVAGLETVGAGMNSSGNWPATLRWIEVTWTNGQASLVRHAGHSLAADAQGHDADETEVVARTPDTAASPQVGDPEPSEPAVPSDPDILGCVRGDLATCDRLASESSNGRLRAACAYANTISAASPLACARLSDLLFLEGTTAAFAQAEPLRQAACSSANVSCVAEPQSRHTIGGARFQAPLRRITYMLPVSGMMGRTTHRYLVVGLTGSGPGFSELQVRGRNTRDGNVMPLDIEATADLRSSHEQNRRRIGDWLVTPGMRLFVISADVSDLALFRIEVFHQRSSRVAHLYSESAAEYEAARAHLDTWQAVRRSLLSTPQSALNADVIVGSAASEIDSLRAGAIAASSFVAGEGGVEEVFWQPASTLTRGIVQYTVRLRQDWTGATGQRYRYVDLTMSCEASSGRYRVTDIRIGRHQVELRPGRSSGREP